MQTNYLFTYGLVAGVTPVLVLMNTVLINATSSSAATMQPFQPMALADRLMEPKPDALVTASDLMPLSPDAVSLPRMIQRDSAGFPGIDHPLSPSLTPALPLTYGHCSRG